MEQFCKLLSWVIQISFIEVALLVRSFEDVCKLKPMQNSKSVTAIATADAAAETPHVPLSAAGNDITGRK